VWFEEGSGEHSVRFRWYRENDVCTEELEGMQKALRAERKAAEKAPRARKEGLKKPDKLRADEDLPNGPIQDSIVEGWEPILRKPSHYLMSSDLEIALGKGIAGGKEPERYAREAGGRC
jgi:hypothetical protein